MAQRIISEVTKQFLTETRALAGELQKSLKRSELLLPHITMVKDNAAILQYYQVNHLLASLENVYLALVDKKIVFTDHLQKLILLVQGKLTVLCAAIEQEGTDADEDIQLYQLYCDKATVGEIFDVDVFTKKNTVRDRVKLTEEKDVLIQVHSKDVTQVLKEHEEMIARTYKMGSLIDSLKTIKLDNNSNKLSDIQKTLASDLQILQSSLLLAHDGVTSFIENQGDGIQKNQTINGFFVFANKQKYFISTEHVTEITYESPMEYVVQQNQRYLKIELDEDIDNPEERVRLIPIYSLSSLLPGQQESHDQVIDTILITEYSGQEIGIIVDHVQKFLTLTNNPLPSAFADFPILQGIAFDEKYDMIPILYVPEILKRFRSLRGYDIKKFEANTRRKMFRILIVDDSEITRQIESNILSEDNAFIDQACDGIRALEMAREKQYDLIVTDDKMPRMNGQILLDNLRRMENYAQIPVVVMATHPIEKADAFVSKSDFTRTDLVHTVKELLHG